MTPTSADTDTEAVGRTESIAAAAVVALSGLFALRRLSSHDLGFHLSAGNHVLAGGGWPRTDPFTFTVTDHPYIDTSWGYQVVVALLERIAGAPAIVLFHVGLVVTLLLLLASTVRLVRGARYLAPLLLLVTLTIEPRLEARPEIWSYTLLALVLYLLHRHAEGRPSPLWLLAPIFLVWANSHSLFILGWGVLACFVAGGLVRDRRLDRPLLLWSAASVAVTLVNPYGWRAPAFAIGLATRMSERNVFGRNIGEFASPLEQVFSDELHFYFLSSVAYLTLLALVLASSWGLWRRRRISALILVFVFVPLSLTMIRNAPLLALACSPGVAWGLGLGSPRGATPRTARMRALVSRAVTLAILVVTLTLGARVATDAYYIAGRRLERFGLEWNRIKLPVDAAAYAQRVGLGVGMLNHLNFGGYLMWALDAPVFIDGRLEVMGEDFFEEYRAALGSPAGLEQAVARYGIRWIVFPYRLRPDLTLGLSRHPGWRLLYVDHIAAIFAREGPGIEALVDVSAREADAPILFTAQASDLPGLGTRSPNPVGRWLSGLVRRQRYPTRPTGLGQFHLSREESAGAGTQFAEAIERSGGAYYELYDNLAIALFGLGRLDESRACVEHYLDRLPLYRRERRRLALERLDEIGRRAAGPDRE